MEHEVSIFVRRGGPNYQEGLRLMEDLGTTSALFCKTVYDIAIGPQLGIPLYVFGPESHMTSIVAMALGKRKVQRAVLYRSRSLVCSIVDDSAIMCDVPLLEYQPYLFK